MIHAMSNFFKGSYPPDRARKLRQLKAAARELQLLYEAGDLTPDYYEAGMKVMMGWYIRDMWAGKTQEKFTKFSDKMTLGKILGEPYFQ